MRNSSSKLQLLSPLSKRQTAIPPITAAGIEKYHGILAASAIHEIIVSGTLPKGETTANVTYWIVDRDTRAIVSQVVLPDRSNQFNRVEMRLKVGRLSGGYQIGTFAPNGEFRPADFLSIRSDLDPLGPSGPTGRIT
jgi:hypothetical protein